MMFLHSYKCLAADHSGHAVVQPVITVFHPWDAGIVGSDAWIYVHIFSTFSPVKYPRTNKDLYYSQGKALSRCRQNAICLSYHSCH